MEARKWIFIAGIVCNVSLGCAQSLDRDVIATAGEDARSHGGSLSWTLGEPVSDVYAHHLGYLTQGFQQPSQIRVTSVQPSEDNGLVFYPNPVKDILILEATHRGKYQVQLFNTRGERIVAEQMDVSGTPVQHHLNLEMFSTALYVLRITNITTQKTYVAKIEKQ